MVVTLLLLRFISSSSSSARPSLPTRAATEGSDAVESRSGLDMVCTPISTNACVTTCPHPWAVGATKPRLRMGAKRLRFFLFYFFFLLVAVELGHLRSKWC